MRFVPPVAALALGPVAIDGDENARRRPMRTTIQALRDLGVDVGDDGRGTMPFTIQGSGERRGRRADDRRVGLEPVRVGAAAGRAALPHGLTLRHVGDRLPSMPHIEMTIATLARRGVVVESPEPGVWVVPPGPIAGAGIAIEPDLSNAAPFLAAALIAGRHGHDRAAGRMPRPRSAITSRPCSPASARQ